MHGEVTDSSPATERTEQRPSKLKMAHVVFMDIVGYSKLPMDHQEAVLRTLQEVVSSAPVFLYAEANKEMIRLPTATEWPWSFSKMPKRRRTARWK